jgi:hypothetical protein
MSKRLKLYLILLALVIIMGVGGTAILNFLNVESESILRTAVIAATAFTLAVGIPICESIIRKK